MSNEEHIILNVGGIKYETFRSTLMRFPNTLLGKMFHQQNRSFLRPTNGNEYFLDRNGYAFRYILEYYRTGVIIWPEYPSAFVSREELTIEFFYFEISVPQQR
ncbi:1668_t:CDS:2 [Ambispora leptoticha]|uniref:1668_t:CDS:1 n=1 Tax=Ambispora leptoticha TaxID=144679 RepID=A0A9N9G0R3_9GLOM|nr:1668_t:CDS:2 [Ambispora leptoticha]